MHVTQDDDYDEGVKFHSHPVEKAGTKKDHATAHKTIMKRQTHLLDSTSNAAGGSS